jgi:hypothetical protein
VAAHNLNWLSVTPALATAVITGLATPAGIADGKNTLILPEKKVNAPSQGEQLV